MTIIEGAVLGLIQGLTEFIPVSSSGHLVIAQNLFNGRSEHMFLQWIDVGTFLALVVYFRHKLIDIYKNIFFQRDYRLARNILLTSAPAGLVGVLFSGYIQTNPFFGSIITVTTALAVVGVIMIILEKLPHKSVVRDGDHLSTSRALTIGFLQIFALIPGVSRSGSTIIAGRLMGLSAARAAEYSFLASLPIIAAVLLKLIITSDGRQYYIDNFAAITAGNVVAFISALFAVKFLLGYLSKHGLAIFGWYRIVLASVIVIVLLIQSV